MEAAGFRVVQLLSVKRLSSAESGVGTGKAEELRKIAEDTKSQMIIVDDRLFLPRRLTTLRSLLIKRSLIENA